MRKLLACLWLDDAGALLAAEYLALASVVSLGVVSGMSTIADSVNSEFAELGNSVHAVTHRNAPASKSRPATSAAVPSVLSVTP